MSADSKNGTSKGCENPLISEEQQEKIDEVRRLVGPLPDKLLSIYCSESSDASISRYLRAQNWNVDKATKKLKEALKWRLEYKPEAIGWDNHHASIKYPAGSKLARDLTLARLLMQDEVAPEAATGKMYRSSYAGKHGRTVLVMRPSCQNSESTEAQIRYLVYCIENAVMNLPQNQEEMIWLIDFHGFNLSNISVKSTRETAHVLQDYYPERLGVAILYNAPKFFQPFWRLAKYFLETKSTINKIKFVYSDDPNTKKIMEDIFDMNQLESAFGGKENEGFDINKYAQRMREDDKRMQSLRARGNIAGGGGALEEKADKSSIIS